MKFGKISVTLKGLTPLLMNRFSVESLKRESRSTLKEYNTVEDAAKAAYIDEIDGKRQLYVPAKNVYTMILQTSGKHKIGKHSARGILAGLMRVIPDKIPLGTDKYEVDIQGVNVQRAKVARARPRLDEWKLDFEIVYESELIANPYIIRDILEEAGFRMGLLDFRPQHTGSYGTFIVEKFEVQNP